MERIVKERDRLVQRSARLIGMTGAVVALLCLAMPGAVAPATLVLLVPLFAAFGALLYHFGTRRLSFLKDPTLLAVVQALPEHPSARAALAASGADAAAQRRLARALATLAATDMITERTETPS